MKLLRSSLTVDGEVDGVLPVPRWERGVLADVGGLVGQPQRGEGDGGVLQRGRPPPHGAALERHAVPVGRRHRHAQCGIDDGHVLLGAVDQLLPGDLDGGGRRAGGGQEWISVTTVTFFTVSCSYCQFFSSYIYIYFTSEDVDIIRKYLFYSFIILFIYYFQP